LNLGCFASFLSSPFLSTWPKECRRNVSHLQNSKSLTCWAQLFDCPSPLHLFALFLIFKFHLFLFLPSSSFFTTFLFPFAYYFFSQRSDQKKRRRSNQKKKNERKKKARGISEDKDSMLAIFASSRSEGVSLAVHHGTPSIIETPLPNLFEKNAFLGKDQEGFVSTKIISNEDIIA